MTGHQYVYYSIQLIAPRPCILCPMSETLAEWSRAEWWSQQDPGGIFALPLLILRPLYLACNLGHYEDKTGQGYGKL